MPGLRLLLLPFSLIYGCITGLRNFLYNRSILKSFFIPKKSICVGNLAVGGTGKTPHVAFLVDFLKNEYQISILSRGYGRKTKGYIEATNNSLSSEIGDEPKLYKLRYKNDVNVTVCEKREVGIKEIQKKHPHNDLIILDDAFQHRAVKAEMNLLLTDFSKLYTSDFMLPSGTLREWSIGAKRAQLVIVTKSPENLSEIDKKRIVKKLKRTAKNTYFSSIEYGAIISFNDLKLRAKKYLLVTGIANPHPLLKHLRNLYDVELLQFPDHYTFTKKDIEDIHQKFDTFVEADKVIITTEKDYMRLSELINKTKINDYPWFYQSISIKMDRDQEFKALIKEYVDTI